MNVNFILTCKSCGEKFSINSYEGIQSPPVRCPKCGLKLQDDGAARLQDALSALAALPSCLHAFGWEHECEGDGAFTVELSPRAADK